jgi:hypothetical protein
MSSRTRDRGAVPAALWRRFLALAVDAVPAFALVAILAAVIVGTDPDPTAIPPWNPLDRVVDYLHLETARFVAIVIASVTLLVFLQAAQIARFGGTIGMRVAGLAPVLLDATDGRPRLLRSVVWVAVGLALGALGAATFWWGLAAPSRRTLHDRLAGVGLDEH